MHRIDLDTWPRGAHFKIYSAFDHPHFNMCANVDITVFRPCVKRLGTSFSIATVYMITRAANAIPEFRYRIRPGEVVEHEIVHPSTTILTAGELFSFCTFEYTPEYPRFAEQAERQVEQIRHYPTLKDTPGRDDYLFMTAIPWVSFTSFMHPLHMHPVDSIPRFAWGKYFHEGERLKMPLSVQGHHAVMDGLHMGRFYVEIQDYFDRAGQLLGDAG